MSGSQDYYSLKFDWRERINEAEDIQLEKISDFLNHQPKLINRLSLELIDLDALSMDEQTGSTELTVYN